MALDNGYHFAAQALPTPTNTPYDSPSMDIPIQSPPQGSPFPSSDNAFAPLPPSEDSSFPKQQEIIDHSSVDKNSAHESRRFTPNDLGITLVSQIHSLRKELGSKDGVIESLEETVHKSRAENEQLTTDLKVQKAEVTSVKRKMQSLEKEMLQALEDIAKERDNALEITADTRKRLEDSTRKIRVREEDANKAHALWEKDRQTWDDKRRKLEGRVHIVEERLKTMVAEMLIVQTIDQKSAGFGDDLNEGMKDAWSGDGNDNSDIPVTSNLIKRHLDESHEHQERSNFRSSRMSGLHGLGGSQMSGLSLAEELESDEGENAVEGGDNEENALPNDTYDLPKQRPEDVKAKQVMDLHIGTDEDLHGDEASGQHSIGIINDYIDFPGKELETNYTDIGIRSSSPQSPSPQPQQQQQQSSFSGKGIEQTEPTANQSRKRINIPQMFVGQTPALKSAQPSVCMVSVGSQTVGEPEGPALTAHVANKTSVLANTLRSTSTQTSGDPVPAPKHASSRLSPSSQDVPVIAIHPPASRPSSSRNSVMLPPRTRNAACQAVIELPNNMISNSMQTEDTRVDKQSFGEPPRLPSLDLPPQLPLPFAERTTEAGTISGLESSWHSLRSPMKTGKSRPSKRTAKIKKAFPGENDNGPLNPNQRSGPRRPIRSGSIFAGFDVSSDDDRGTAHDHFSDDEFLNAAPIRKTLSKVQNSWKLVPHLRDSVLERLESASEEAEDEKRKSVPKPLNAKATVPSRTTSKNFHNKAAESYRVTSNRVKQPDIRRKALVSNSIVKHQRQSRSPSESDVLGGEATIAPPFPVPNRLSSRKVLPSKVNDGPASPSPNTRTFFSTRRGQYRDRPFTERNILRKVQSAAAVTQPSVPLRPESMLSMSASSTVPPSPKSTAPRLNHFMLPCGSVAELSSHSARSPSRAGVTSVGTPNEQSSAVDAIAQTMVGEWMWKYIRKRSSFGMTENPPAEIESGRNGDHGNGSGVRHKRWVWLAPFERAVIWSSKQPSSGPALLGKGARKLAIQSVLDVKDDTPLPKNAGSQDVFDRSILILTPPRALRFTATSRERHYIWLAALSYLCHSTPGLDDLARLAPLPEQFYHHHLPSHEPVTRLPWTPTQESTRFAKGRRRLSISGHSYTSPIGLIEREMIEGTRLPWEDNGAAADDAAEPPQVYRVAAHVRKRSNSTEPRSRPLGAFYSYPNNVMAVASSCSLQAPTSRDKYDRFTPRLQIGPAHGIAENNHSPYPVVPDNFFDSTATVRMEAFVEGKDKEQMATKRRKSFMGRQGRKKDMSFWGFDRSAAGGAMGQAGLKVEDPFSGF